jgi:hypothetical protein
METPRRIDKPGIYDIGATDYHADVCPRPSLSSGIADVLLTQSPRHAWTAHPRLNPNFRPEEKEAFDLGTAAHALLLQGESNFVIIDARDYRTKAAQEQRDAARADGKVPLLAHRWADVQAMVAAAREQLDAMAAPIPFTNGRPEESLVWEEDGVWLRARLDWFHLDHRTVDDYKTTQASAHPAVWSRTLFGNGADLQAAFYVRGVKALLGYEADFRFIVQENYPPYALSVIALDPEAMAFATAKVERAIALWRECLSHNRWPGYIARTAYAEVPAYELAKWEGRAYYEEESAR